MKKTTYIHITYLCILYIYQHSRQPTEMKNKTTDSIFSFEELFTFYPPI